jgi:hypothetical protein
MTADVATLLIWGVILLGFGAYTRNVQLTTLGLGKAIGAADSAAGLQDAITPKWQTRNNIIVLVLLLLFSIQAFVTLPWYFAIATILAAFFIGIPVVARTVMPRPMSKSLIGKLKTDLAERKAEFERNGDSVRASVADEVLSRIAAYEQRDA